MKQLARRAPLAVVLLLLASVGTASAECAWVAWGQMIEKTPPGARQAAVTWTPLGGHATLPDCRAAIADKATAETERTTLIVWCLPDTIDPRGPKGR